MDWAVATTQPACEHKASDDLVSVGFTAYYPKIEHVEAVRGRIVKRVRPLFPGYLFFELVDAWREVFRFDRILGVLKWRPEDEEPARVSQSQMDKVLMLEGPDGLIRLETTQPRPFGPGSKVRITKGAFVSFEGVVAQLQGKDRLQVLFDLFGRKTTVCVRETECTAA